MESTSSQKILKATIELNIQLEQILINSSLEKNDGEAVISTLLHVLQQSKSNGLTNT